MTTELCDWPQQSSPIAVANLRRSVQLLDERLAELASGWSNQVMNETTEDLEALQRLLDDTAGGAGEHLRSVITDDRRLSAEELCRQLQGMRLLTVGTVTADGRPLVGPVDGYFLRGSFYFSSAPNSVRMRHLAVRPGVSATHLPGEDLAVTVHGRAELFNLSDPRHPALLQAMLDHYLPLQGPDFESWLDDMDPIGARIVADKMFTFVLDVPESPGDRAPT